MKEAVIIFPHQLFKDNPALAHGAKIFLVEEFLFFLQYKFHQQKIAFHRASMKAYQVYLENKGQPVDYIEANDNQSDVRKLIAYLHSEGYEKIHFTNPTDNWLEKRIKSTSSKFNIELIEYENPLFINTRSDLESFFKPQKKKFFQTEFYKQERKRLNLLIDKDQEPVGGKWTFDAENRKKYPKNKKPPVIEFPESNIFYQEAANYTSTHFSDNLGSLKDLQYYPNDFVSADQWLDQFLKERFDEFGVYEDAIVSSEIILNHSVLTPMINTGLLIPSQILHKVMEYHENISIPINSLEGFVRQVIGWREFIRGVYEVKGVEERTRNFWGFKRKIPSSFYDGTTGILPLDDTIKKVLKTGYCHHIERLMILGNFMLLCEFDPDEVYRWFMELFIDAYDWVMVPNIYGMSQFADGGLISTKPYISGSNYIMKMSNYPKGDWQETWDFLFWRFMHVHRDFFTKNPRLGMLIKTFDKRDPSKREETLRKAESFLGKL